MVWLDCCYSGGFPSGAIAKAQESVFTSAIVAGLRSGDADLNRDGEIDAGELYEYVYDWVKARTPNQTPTRNDQVTGQLYIASSRKGIWLPAELPAEIRGLRSSLPSFRGGHSTSCARGRPTATRSPRKP